MMLGFSLIASIAKVVGYDIKDSWCRFMIAGTVLVGGTAGVLIPFQGVPTMSLTVFDKYAEQTGLLVDRGAYVTAVVMSSVLLILCFTFLARKVLRLDVTPLKRLNVADIVEGHTVKLSRKQVIITVIMLVSYLYPVFLMPLDKASAAYTLLNDRIGRTMFMGLAVAALALIGEKGEPYYDLEKNIGSDVMRGAIAALCAGDGGRWCGGLRRSRYQGLAAVDPDGRSIQHALGAGDSVLRTGLHVPDTGLFQYGNHYYRQLHHRTYDDHLRSQGLQCVRDPGFHPTGRYERDCHRRRFRLCCYDVGAALL